VLNGFWWNFGGEIKEQSIRFRWESRLWFGSGIPHLGIFKRTLLFTIVIPVGSQE